MTPEQLAKYTDLLLQAYALGREIAAGKFTNTDDYLAALAKVAALYNEAAAVFAAAGGTGADIDAATAKLANKIDWTDPVPPSWDAIYSGAIPSDETLTAEYHFPAGNVAAKYTTDDFWMVRWFAAGAPLTNDPGGHAWIEAGVIP